MFNLTVVFPKLPDMRLSTNGRGNLHYMERSKLVKEARDEAYYLAKDALSKCDYWTAPAKARISYEFYMTDHRVKDMDNLVSACKPWCDSLVAAGIINSDSGWDLALGSGDFIFSNEKQTRLIIKPIEE